MRLQFHINSQDTKKQFSCLLRSLILANSIRKSAIFKFKEDEMMIISTSAVTISPMAGGNGSASGGTFSQSESQLWLKLHTADIFQEYLMKTKRADGSITMELSIDPLIQVLKKYDQMMKRGEQAHTEGSNGNMEIKMMNVPKEWNMVQSSKNSGYGSLRVSFEEQVPGKATAIKHLTYIPIKLVSSQHELRQPIINEQQIVYKLPNLEEDGGKQFGQFMKRLDRFSGLECLKVCGNREEIKLLVDEMDWYMEVKWNGVLQVLAKEDEGEDSASYHQEENLHDTQQSVIIRARDWKICTRLFETLGDQNFLCLSDKQYCLFNSIIKDDTNSFDRNLDYLGAHDDHADDTDETGTKFMDISFYIANTRS